MSNPDRRFLLVLSLALLVLAGIAPAAAERIKGSPGQPLCIDQDSLAALMLAAIQKNPEAAKNVACEGMKPGSTAEVIERYPSGADFMRVVKVRVKAPGRGPTVGYTFELDRLGRRES